MRTLEFVLPQLAPPSWSLLLAVVIASLTGAAHAAKRGFDVIGVVGLAIATGLGGLLLSSVLMQTGTPLVLLEDQYVIGAALAGLVGFFFAGVINRAGPLMFVMESLALGYFVAYGTDFALRLALHTGAALFLGVLTAVGGLVLRDVLSGDAPQIMRPGVFITVAVLAGGLAFIGLSRYSGLSGGMVQLLTIATVLLVRILARWRGWETHAAVDYSSRIWRRWSRSA